MNGEKFSRTAKIGIINNKKSVFKMFILSAFIIIIAFFLSACSSGGNGKNNSTKDNDANLKAAYKAYLKILTENQSRIDLYEKMIGASSEIKHGHPTALCDITGDGIPELLFFIADKDNYSEDGGESDNPRARLKIYTFIDGKAKEIDYNFRYPKKFFVEMKETKLTEFGSMSLLGGYYLVSKGKKPGEFFITFSAASSDGGGGIDFVYKYRIKKDGTAEIADSLKIQFLNDVYRTGKQKLHYTVNGEKCEIKTCRKKMKEARVDIDKSLLYKVYGSGGVYKELDWSLSGKDIYKDMSKTVSDLRVELEQNRKLDKKVAKIYYDILQENQNDIRAYKWQYEKNKNRYIEKNVTIKDLNNDGIPELMFFALNNGDRYAAALHVYTVKNGKAVELKFKTPEKRKGNSTGNFIDAQVASGKKYVIYSLKNKSGFGLVYSIADESNSFYFAEYSVDKNSNIKQEKTLNCRYAYNDLAGYQGESARENDRWLIENKAVKKESFNEEVKKYEKNIEEILLFSGNVEYSQVSDKKFLYFSNFKSADGKGDSCNYFMALLKKYSGEN